MDLAYCGLNCGECAVYLASVRKDTAGQIFVRFVCTITL